MNEIIKVKGATGCFSGIELIKSIKVYTKLSKGELRLFSERAFPIDINTFLVKELTINTTLAKKQRKKLNILNLSMINFYNICKEEVPYYYLQDCKDWLGPDISAKLNKFIAAIPERFYRIEEYEPPYVKGINKDKKNKYVIEIISFFESVIPYAIEMNIMPEIVKIFKRQIEYKTEEDYDDFIDNWAKKLLGRDEDEDTSQYEDENDNI